MQNTPRVLRPVARARLFSAAAGAKPVKAAPSMKVVFVDGCRIPFQPSRNEYFDLMSYDLSRMAMQGLLTKTALNPKEIDYVLWGKVIQEPKTSNIARDAAFAVGIPQNVPAHTVTQACISSNQAICSGAAQILAGQADVVLAGGVETFSDAPIRYTRPIRKKLIQMSKAKSTSQMASMFFKGLKMKDLAPEQPAIANFLTGEVRGWTRPDDTLPLHRPGHRQLPDCGVAHGSCNHAVQPFPRSRRRLCITEASLA
jgi:hypothetical protein